MLDHLFIKYLCEQNVVNICYSDIVTGLWLHFSHRIDIYPYLMTIYHDIFLLNIKVMCIMLSKKFTMNIWKHSFLKTE